MIATKRKSWPGPRTRFARLWAPWIASLPRVRVVSALLLLVSAHAILARYLDGPSAPMPLAQLPDGDPRLQLTIVLDRQRGDEQCVAFIHRLLPPWVRWRYVAIVDDDDLDALEIGTPALVVTRWIEERSWIRTWASQHRYSVGLMLMADETNVQNATVYSDFHYVLRHYYFRHLASHPDLVVRAVGNLTCGTGPVFPPDPPAPDEPALGVHWIMLQGRGLGNLDSGHLPGSYWPASQRGRPAIWIGSLRADRAEMVDVMRAAFPDADIQVEDGFGGRTGPLEYGHRLAEVLDQGSIPVFLEAEFQRATFSPVPGVRAQSWEDAALQMKALLQDPIRLDRLQDEVVAWWQAMQSCMRGDLDILLRAASTLR